MNLSHLKDQELHLKVKSLDAEEKRLVVEILHHLLEVDRRRLFSVYGHSSLFQYTVKELGYSEDQAYRRINSMRAWKSRVIPAKEKRAVWKKHEGRCANCKSQHALEIDHIIPYAWGGLTEEKNLRLLCRACNQRHAIEKLGLKKMAPYLSSV